MSEQPKERVGLNERIYGGAAAVGSVRMKVGAIFSVIIGIALIVLGQSVYFTPDKVIVSVVGIVKGKPECTVTTTPGDGRQTKTVTTTSCNYTVEFTPLGTVAPIQKSFTGANTMVAEGESIKLYYPEHEPFNATHETTISNVYTGAFTFAFGLVFAIGGVWSWYLSTFEYAAAETSAVGTVGLLSGAFMGR
jgi:hypothetical protein